MAVPAVFASNAGLALASKLIDGNGNLGKPECILGHQSEYRSAFIGREEMTSPLHQVIVMELCTGGSLFNLLDDPENSYGLDEVSTTRLLLLFYAS